MYERNAIVLERYFNRIFGYNAKNNIKTNFKDYCDLVECLERYKNISEEEENIIQEYDSIANTIREIQKTQENLNKKNIKLLEDINNIFQNIDEDTNSIQKKITSINNNIQETNNKTQENQQLFIKTILEFNEKTKIRTTSSRARRNIENEYNKKINMTLDNYKEIDLNYEKKAKQFIEMNTESLEKDLKEEMKKNGEKEKIPFNADVITKAITLCVDIQKRQADIYAGIYDKTNRLFNEIKNNTVKIEKHKKIIKDAKSKLNFLASLKEYLVQFLDNERLTSVNGEEEHDKLMKDACKNLDEDLLQINNLYTLLLKEIGKKITKKSYSELYNYSYLEKLEEKTKEFDDEIRKLNLSVTIINPNHWRIEGMKKIYETFNKCVIEEYDRDLTEYLPKQEIDVEEEIIEKENDEIDEIDEKEEKQSEKKNMKDPRSEIDKKIDMILGIATENEEDDDEDFEEDWEDEQEENENIDDDWEEEKNIENDWDDEEDDGNIDNSFNEEEDFEQDNDDWEDENSNDSEEEEEDSEKIEEFEENYDEESNDDDFDENDKIFNESWDEDEEDDDDDEEDDEERQKSRNKILNKNKKKKNKKKKESSWNEDNIWKEENKKNEDAEKSKKRRERTEEEWENAFIRIEQKNREKRKGFFDKFKR